MEIFVLSIYIFNHYWIGKIILIPKKFLNIIFLLNDFEISLLSYNFNILSVYLITSASKSTVILFPVLLFQEFRSHQRYITCIIRWFIFDKFGSKIFLFTLKLWISRFFKIRCYILNKLIIFYFILNYTFLTLNIFLKFKMIWLLIKWLLDIAVAVLRLILF